VLRDYTSFDLIATAQLTEGLCTSVNSPTAPGSIVVSPGNGRRSTQCLRITDSNATGGYGNVRRTLDAQATWGVGFAYRISSVAAAQRDLFAVRDGGSLQVDFVLNTDGTITATRNGTALGTTTLAISSAAYYFLEFKVTIHASAGAVKVRINNAVALNLTGINTKATANATANELVFGYVRLANAVGAVQDLDDLHIYDGQAGAITDCIGDCRIDALHPVADVVSDFTPSAGVTNYPNVDDSTPDGDSTYNESTTVSNVDRFTFETLPALTSPTIYAVKVSLYARNPEPGVRTITAQAESNASTADGTSHSLGGTYLSYYDLFEEDPDTSAAWDQAGINGGSFGYKVSS
jgi:hypothetical protein